MLAEPLHTNPVVTALLEELGRTISVMTGSTLVLARTDGPGAGDWITVLRVAGLWDGEISLGVSKADSARLVQAVVGDETEPDEAGIRDLLTEVVGQAAGSVRERTEGTGVQLTVAAPATPGSPPTGEPVSYAASVTPAFAPTFTVWSQLRPGEVSSRAASTSSPGHTPAASVASRLEVVSATSSNLDVILDIDLPLSVRFGQTEMSLDMLTRLGPGSVIDLGRTPDQPVDVLVNGRLIARAEVVVVSGSYGVRILEVVSTADRVRSIAE